ncbi:MAG TPA: V-type ATP synthase subunit I [Candidatus Norongarragalinales archaeon]|nr:V-type ATP synthase subunit I [Candidatus Norongarragalinales archaeon]
MLTLEKMKKVRVIAPRDDARKAVQALYDFGAIQVQECKIADLDAPLPDFQEISEMLIRLRAEERLLNLKGAASSSELELSEMRERFLELGFPALDEKRERLQELENTLGSLKEEKGLLLPFRNLNVDISLVKSQRLNLVYFEPRPGAEMKIESALRKIGHELLVVEDGKRRFWLLAYDARQQEKVQPVVARNAATILEIPKIRGNFGSELKRLETEITATNSQILEITDWIGEYKGRNGGQILGLLESLKVASLKSELTFKFGKTAYFSVVEGWIQAKDFDSFSYRISGMDSALIESVATEEIPPSKLKNPKLIRPFQFLIEFFSLPKSYEIDPTLFIAITYPIFFGMIMGDIGYGMLSLFIALAIKLKSKSEALQKLGGMLALSALSSIFFGLIFAEFFGLEHIFGIEMHPLIHRANDVTELMNIAILIGVVHLALGYIISIATNAIHGHSKHAIARFGWLLIEISMIAAVVGSVEISLLEIFAPLALIYPMPFSAFGILLGMFLIAYLESPTHLMELPSLLANILSYLRIAALGLSGVIIAMIINQLPVDFDGFFAMLTLQRPFDIGAALSFVFFASIFVLGHIGALVIAIVESGIQSLRLHYVEFFSKFYEGGGLPFTPLRDRENKK